ncbi:MAG: hypothetical protein DLM59_04760 [Pseudonocardiales bacterium]|nr:MAG: hypothetical protein DLM59_04760 [Pseudonocardiales bacterium]
MGGGFVVEPGALDLTAEVFQGEAGDTGTHAAEFAASARLPDSAFGNLPISYKLANQYQDFFQQVQNDLTTLQGSLVSVADRLAATAANYRATEEANTLRRHYPHRPHH